jgi:hypothetical protein
VTIGVRVTPPVPPPLTVKAMEVVRTVVPLVPVIVTVAGPVTAVAEALKVTMLLLAVVDKGLKLALTPVGNPLAVNATLPAKPPVRAMAIVLVAVAP